MSDIKEASKSPEEIWKAASGITHQTSYALARIRSKQDNSAEGDARPAASPDTEGRVELMASIDDTSDHARLSIKLRARVKFANHVVAYEEVAQVRLDEALELSKEEIQAFGTHYMLPFLLPYVEVGLDRMCAEINHPAPSFPMFVVKGQLYANDLAETDEGESSPTDDA